MEKVKGQFPARFSDKTHSRAMRAKKKEKKKKRRKETAHPGPRVRRAIGRVLTYASRDGAGAMSASASTVASGGSPCGTQTCGSRPKMQSIAADCAPMARMLHQRRVYANAADRRSSGWSGATLRRTRSFTTVKTSGPQRPPSSHAKTCSFEHRF